MNMLAARLNAKCVALGASDEEVAILAAVSGDVVRAWRSGETDIDPTSAIRLRPFLAEGNAGAVALERIRQRRTESWLGQDLADWPKPPEPVLDGGGWK